MATKFQKGDVVRMVMAVPPEGPVEGFKMLEDGTVLCRITWTDVDGNSHEKWVREDRLVKV
jgi:hypothetical protein